MPSLLVIHYHRYEGDYDDWSLWTWRADDGKELSNLEPAGRDEFGLVFHCPCEARRPPRKVGLLPRLGDWTDKDPPDRIWTPELGNEVFLVQADRAVYRTRPSLVPRVVTAFLDRPELVCVDLNTPTPVKRILADSLTLRCGSRVVGVDTVEPYDEHSGLAKTFIVTLSTPFNLEHVHEGRCSVALRQTEPALVRARYVLDDPRFYTDEPLGPQLSAEGLTIRVWAPCAQSVTVVLAAEPPLPPPGDSERAHSMTRTGTATWELHLPGDYRNWWYRLDTRLVHEPDIVQSVLDPYARAVSRRHNAAVLVDDATEVAPGPQFDFEDAVIYEIHVRDATIDASSGVAARGTYLGLTEAGTHLPGDERVSTALAHFSELGVNTLQLMPVHVFELNEDKTAHAWGYMTVHFNAPEYVYATDRSPATAVRELKEMIGALHRHGFKVVMDVVYNHSTESDAHPVHWNGLAPQYFYRVRPDGTYWNGSGCGNEFRSEGPMARRFLIDSLTYWVREYGIDGFRFDLMGLIDLETMLDVVTVLRRISPGIFIYGEPWPGGETPVRVTGKGDQKNRGFSCFNDNFRIAIAGGVFDATAGYAFDGRDRRGVMRGLTGSHAWFTARPSESINYVECHDNRTLRDKIEYVAERGDAKVSAPDEPAVDRLAAVLLLLAQGVPFLHLGQDFYRTKFGEDNSYDRGDEVNRVRWAWKQRNLDLFDFYRGLVGLRATHPVLRLRTHAEIKERMVFGVVPSPYLVCEYDCEGLDDFWLRALLLVNPTTEPWIHASPDPRTNWYVHVDGARASTDPLYALARSQKDIIVQPRSAVLLAEIEQPGQ